MPDSKVWDLYTEHLSEIKKVIIFSVLIASKDEVRRNCTIICAETERRDAGIYQYR